MFRKGGLFVRSRGIQAVYGEWSLESSTIEHNSLFFPPNVIIQAEHYRAIFVFDGIFYPCHRLTLVLINLG